MATSEPGSASQNDEPKVDISGVDAGVSDVKRELHESKEELVENRNPNGLMPHGIQDLSNPEAAAAQSFNTTPTNAVPANNSMPTKMGQPPNNPLNNPTTTNMANFMNSKGPRGAAVWAFDTHTGKYGWIQEPLMPPSNNGAYSAGYQGAMPFMSYNPYQHQQYQAQQAIMHASSRAEGRNSALGSPQQAMMPQPGVPNFGPHAGYPFVPGGYPGYGAGMHVLMPLRPQAIIQRPPVVLIPKSQPLPGYGIPVLSSGMMSMLNRQQKANTAKASRAVKRREEEGVTDEEEEDLEELSDEDEDGELVLSDGDDDDGVFKMKGEIFEGIIDTARPRPKRESLRKVDYSTFDKDVEVEEEEEGVVKTKVPKASSGESKPRKKRADVSVENVEEFLEDGGEDEEAAQETAFIEKILTARYMSYKEATSKNNDRILRELDGGELEDLRLKPAYEPEGESLLFLVKITGKSYLHLEWVTKELLVSERGGRIRYNRFMKKYKSKDHKDYSNVEIPLFDPLCLVVERILYHHVDEEGDRSYYVKWAGLEVDSCTWEYEGALMNLEGTFTDSTEPSTGADKIADYNSNLTPSEAKQKAATTLASQRANLLASAGEKTLTPAMLSLMIGTSSLRPTYSEWTQSPIFKNDNLLRSYQLEGVNWLMFCWINRQSCIIADEMGLGKTVQSVVFLQRLMDLGLPGPFLIVAPLSTLPHWRRELEAWTTLRVLLYHGKLSARQVLFDYEFQYRDTEGLVLPDMYKFDVLLTTYEMALSGMGHLGDIPWKAAVFDEAHRLKNRASKAAEALATFYLEHKVLLTGTPLQNSVEELWSLLHFLQPTRFFDAVAFRKEYGDMQKAEDVARLQALLKPIMLRRLKADVETSIPVKEETIIEVELTLAQKRYYRAILERNFAFLLRGARGANVPNLLNIMMELRKCCIHPYLIKGAEDQILKEAGLDAHSGQSAQIESMIAASGKLVLLDKLLKKLHAGGHKVLLFSQMTRALDLLSDYLVFRGYSFERIDGSVRGDLRQAAIDRFCAKDKPSPFLFLLCTRAGGVGINLTAADTVILFDSDWNPQNDLQAQARCHRIGQDKHVKVYRLITRGTYERDMFDRAGKKLGLDRAILQRMDSTTDVNSAVDSKSTLPGGLSKKEVEILLKKGAYGVVMDNDEDAVRFCEEDIDQILERRTTVIHHGASTEQDTASLFSKASFTVAQEGGEIDLNAPDFWEKWGHRHGISGVTEKRDSSDLDEPDRSTPIRSARLKNLSQTPISSKRKRALVLDRDSEDPEEEVAVSLDELDDDEDEAFMTNEMDVDDEGRPLTRYGHAYSGRGRPKGSRGGGRPKGSKNRPKDPNAPETPGRGRGRGRGGAAVSFRSKLDAISHHNGRGSVTLVYPVQETAVDPAHAVLQTVASEPIKSQELEQDSMKPDLVNSEVAGHHKEPKAISHSGFMRHESAE